MLRYMLLPFLVFSLIIAAIYSLSVLREGGREPSGYKEAAKPETVSLMEVVRVVNTREGRRQWLIQSRGMEIAGSSVLLDGVDAEVPDIKMAVTAPEGRYDMDSGDLDLLGGVNMVGGNYTVRTPVASLDPGSGEFHSDGEVVIEGGGFRISGTGLLALRQEIRILSDVKAVFY
jgi:hypothetical protein